MIESGIYKIQSKIHPDRIYIGSAGNIRKRCNNHLCGLRNNRHDNSKLQRHFLKYGEDDFYFSVLSICDKSNLIEQEQYYIDLYNPYFNICMIAGRTTGYKHSDEMKQFFSKTRKGRKLSEQHINKLKEAHKYRIFTEETRLKISNTHKGMGHTMDARKKISESHKGKVLSEQHKKNISKALQGRIPTIETRMKLSASNMGHIISEETKRKISIANKGKSNPISEETRKKISIALKGKKKNRKGKDYYIELQNIEKLKAS